MQKRLAQMKVKPEAGGNVVTLYDGLYPLTTKSKNSDQKICEGAATAAYCSTATTAEFIVPDYNVKIESKSKSGSWSDCSSPKNIALLFEYSQVCSLNATNINQNKQKESRKNACI